MASQKQIEANRRNALRSTGPRTATGKSISSRNAFRHGLSVCGEVEKDIGKEVNAHFLQLLNYEPNDKGAGAASEAAAACAELVRVHKARSDMLELLDWANVTPQQLWRLVG